MFDEENLESIPIKKLWEQFIQGKEIEHNSLPEHVYATWIEARNKGIDPKNMLQPKQLSNKELEELREKNKLLIELSRPVFNMIKKSTNETNPLMILTASNKVILEISGDQSILTEKEAAYNAAGVVCNETEMGIRASTLTMREKRPLALVGPEHYLEIFHNSLCYAAPIFDHDRNIIGSISFATALKKYHPHTMTMVATAAENISTQLQKNYEEDKKNYLNSLIYSVCNALPEAIVALDLNNNITYINEVAESLFSQPYSFLTGKSVAEFIHTKNVDELMKAISLRKQKNITIHIKGKAIENRYLCRIQPLFGQNNNVIGMTLFLASDKQLAKGISQLDGNRAFYSFDDIIGNSISLQHCIQLAKKIAKKATRILITGESGTGKELFAQSIHNAGPRRSGPFVAISCASIPRDLVEAELFGYVAGAFTGASKNGAMGKFEQAQNGTLFLDEINSLPMDAQGKLLRALQENEILRVGGQTPIPVNAHVITASNEDLSTLAASKRFREDLLYRINSVEIQIPPLRERRGDVEVLIKHFIAKLARSQHREVQLSPTWLYNMINYNWTGNVRELENACEYSMILCEGAIIMETHLHPSIISSCSIENILQEPCEKVDETYKKWLLTALYAYKGNISKASEKLGLSRGTLYRKMKKYNLESVDFRSLHNTQSL